MRAVPVAVPTVPDFPPPVSLPAVMHPVWEAIVSDMGGRGRLRQSDLPQLAAYVEAVWVHQEASMNVHQFGILVKGSSGPIANPLLKVQKDAAATMLRFADALGLTPSSRIRMAVEEVVGASVLASLNEQLNVAAAARR